MYYEYYKKPFGKLVCYVYLTFLFILFFFCSASYTNAETHITNGDLSGDIRWTKEKSPYILDMDVEIPSSGSLTVDAGVTIVSAPPTEETGIHSIYVSGKLSIQGTEQNPVHITGLDGLYLSNGSVSTVGHALFDATNVNVQFATSTIRSSVFSNANIALYIKKSVVDITDSEFSRNQTGIYSAKWVPIFQARGITGEELGIGGIGNALGDDPNQNRITIHSSVLKDNQILSIKNMTENVVDATLNWWGSEAGPTSGISGAVLSDPWQVKDPKASLLQCCSNVLFLPGIEASRLYEGVSQYPLSGTTSVPRWEPLNNSDVKKLYLSSLGKSVNPAIYTEDILDAGFGFDSKGIYKKFVTMMNSVVAEKTINEWTPFAYDWRFSPADIVTDGVKYATTTKYLISEVERLAHTSETGKVTIIAHSNGGLVAKMLGVELEKVGKSSLVDRVVFVAVPQLGTPQAISALLHGEDQDLLYGFILNQGVARTFGINMLGAYGLLPSKEYFNRLIEPVVAFAGETINSYVPLANFLIGKNDGRKQVKETDTKSPAILSANLLTKSEWMHSLIDTWHFPTSTDVLSLAGWGVQTTETVDYTTESPRFLKSSDGDKTVLTGSALGYGDTYDGNKIYFNQGLYNHENKKKIDHANILEADPIRMILSKIIATSSLVSAASVSGPSNYFSQEKPKASDYPWMQWFTVSVHSPVDVDIYDSHGGHLGIVPIPGHPDSDIKMLEDTMNGDYEQIGEEKYFTFPIEDSYTIKLKGTGTGKFTYQVQKFVGGDMTEVSNVVYSDLPVTPLLVASTTLSSTMLDTPLSLDVDGNGVTDIKVKPNTPPNTLTHLDSMKTIILSLHLKPQIEKRLLDRIERIRSLVLKDKKTKVLKKIQAAEDVFMKKHWAIKKITEKDRTTLADLLDKLLTTLESD